VELKMKISTRQLRRIIREEKRKLLREVYPVGGEEPSPAWKAFEDAAYDVAVGFIDAGMEADGVLDAMVDTLTDMINDMESEWVDEPDPRDLAGNMVHRPR